jgi:hypothetical protein
MVYLKSNNVVLTFETVAEAVQEHRRLRDKYPWPHEYVVLDEDGELLTSHYMGGYTAAQWRQIEREDPLLADERAMLEDWDY